MTIPIELLELRARLEEVGMVVVQEPNYLTVRLPYFCSVRIRAENGRLRFEPFTGMIPRTRSTLIKLFTLSALTIGSFRYGAPYAFGFLVLTLMSSVYDVFRVMITENVVTRASVIYSQFAHEMDSGRDARG